MFNVSKEWVLENRTKRGAWTKAQLACLEVSWPPKKGWLLEVIGIPLLEEAKIKFESFKGG